MSAKTYLFRLTTQFQNRNINSIINHNYKFMLSTEKERERVRDS